MSYHVKTTLCHDITTYDIPWQPYFVASVTFVMHQKVHLLLDDIAVVTAECNERYIYVGISEVRECLELCSTFFRTTQQSFPPRKFMQNNCVVLIN